jgi:SAM-dependent methyltransferase
MHHPLHARLFAKHVQNPMEGAMLAGKTFDAWSAGQSYEDYMGRWSRSVAAEFLGWLDAPAGADWLEIGCGTGALTAGVLSACSPRSILATDPSNDFVDYARQAIQDPRARFEKADAQHLPIADKSVDVVTSALVLNFVPDRLAGLVEMQRVLRPGGILSFYVWDYPGGGIGFIDAFWKAAAAIDPKAAALDEGNRFAFCTAESLADSCAEAGISAPRIAPIEIATEFPGFEEFWHPFTLGAGPAPGYCMSLPDDRRLALKARLSAALGEDGPIRLTARAWAMKAEIGG